jgi:hypothetical protein
MASAAWRSPASGAEVVDRQSPPHASPVAVIAPLHRRHLKVREVLLRLLVCGFPKVWRVAQGSEVIQQVEPGEDLLARGGRMPTRVTGPGGG